MMNKGKQGKSFFSSLYSFLFDITDQVFFLATMLGSAFVFYARFSMLSNPDVLSFIYSSLGLSSSIMLDSFFLGMLSYFAIIPLWSACSTLKYKEDGDNWLSTYFSFLFNRVISIQSYAAFALNLITVLAHVPVISAYIVLALSHFSSVWLMASKVIRSLGVATFNAVASWDFAGAFASIASIIYQVGWALVRSCQIVVNFVGSVLNWCLFAVFQTLVTAIKGFFELIAFGVSAVIAYFTVPFVRNTSASDFSVVKDPCFYVVLTSLLLLFDVISLGSLALNQNIAFILMSWMTVYVVNDVVYNDLSAASMFSDRSMIHLVVAAGVNVLCAAFALPYLLTTVLTFGMPLISRQWMDESRLKEYFNPSIQVTSKGVKQQEGVPVTSNDFEKQEGDVKQQEGAPVSSKGFEKQEVVENLRARFKAVQESVTFVFSK